MQQFIIWRFSHGIAAENRPRFEYIEYFLSVTYPVNIFFQTYLDQSLVKIISVISREMVNTTQEVLAGKLFIRVIYVLCVSMI